MYIFFVGSLLKEKPAQLHSKDNSIQGTLAWVPRATSLCVFGLERGQRDPIARRVTHSSRDFAAMFILSRSDATHAITTVEGIEFSVLYVYNTLKHFAKEAFAQIPHVLHVIQWVLPQFVWIIQSQKP